MDIFLIPALISFITTLSFIPPTILLAKKYNLLDNPLQRPHPARIQKRVIPRAGGLPIFLSIILSILLFIEITPQILGLIIALSLLLIIGLIDDKIQNFSPYIRLIAQFIAGFIVVFSGTSIMFITNPLGGILNFQSFSVPFLGQILTCFWLVWVMNMINWSKGVDGQMPSITTIAALILGLLSIKFYLGGDQNQLEVAKLAFITAASSFGFLLFNWYPAKIFPAFSGSAVLGFMIAFLAILSGAKLATAGLVLLVPAIDFVYTFWRRILQGKSPVWGDRQHLHHKLFDLGWTHQRISLFYIFLSVILGAAALTLNSRDKLFAAFFIGITIFGVIIWLNLFGRSQEHSDQGNG